jgi:hypothetical protein
MMTSKKPDGEYLNKWHFITVGPKSEGYDKEDMEFIHEHALTVWETRVARQIKTYTFGAIDTTDPDAPDKVYIVRWVGEPFPLQEDTVVEGCLLPMERGTMVARGRYLNPVPRGKGWYEACNGSGQIKTFWLRHVLEPQLQMEKFKEGENEPPPSKNSKHFRELAWWRTFKLSQEDRDQLLLTKETRRQMDMVELHWDDPDSDIEEEEEEEEEEDEEDMDVDG